MAAPGQRSLPLRVGVVGGGTMGCGIAATLALAGVPTAIIVRRAAAAHAASERIAARLEAQARLGLAGSDALEEARARIETRVGMGGGPYDLVVESIREDAAAKREVLARAEEELTEEGILCTNTSSLALPDLASALRSPARFAGWHWFHPADLMELVEIVPGPATEASTLRRLEVWSRALGKTPVVLMRDIDGFIGNRLQYALLREAYALVAGGVCSVADVDAVVTGLGPRWAAVGPFATMDLAGLDLHAAIAETLFPHLSRSRTVPKLLEGALERGARGAESGTGLRGSYEPGQAAAVIEARDRALAARLRGPSSTPSPADSQR